MNVRFGLSMGIVAFATFARIMTPPLLGHPSNFSPIDAIAIFSGCYFARRFWKFAVPLLSVWFGDLLIDYLLFHKIMLFYSGFYWQYGCYVMMVVLGMMLSRKVKPLPIIAASLSSSVLFFVVTNFGVWVGSGMYPHSTVGLLACYVAAIPFFNATVASDLVYSVLFFGSVELAKRQMPNLTAIHQVQKKTKFLL